MATLSKSEGVTKISYHLACPFACRHPEHYNTKEGLTSNCVTNCGFTQRQVCRQHLVSEHYAVCPKCFFHKKADNGTPEKNFDKVMEWRHEHLRVCEGPAKRQDQPLRRIALDETQASEFEKLDHKKLVRGMVNGSKEYDFAWWGEVFKALFPGTPIPKPDERYFIPRPDVQKEIADQVASQVEIEVKKRLAKFAEILVHATSLNQVGLREGVIPDPHKSRLLEPYKELLAPKLDMLRGQIQEDLRSGGTLKNVPQPDPTADSGYDSYMGELGSFSQWPSPMTLDHHGGSPGCGQENFLYTGGGAGPYVGGVKYAPGPMMEDLNSEMRQIQRWT